MLFCDVSQNEIKKINDDVKFGTASLVKVQVRFSTSGNGE